MVLWDHKLLRNSNSNIAEKVLSILCHIIKGEATVREKLEKQAEKKQDAGTETKPSVPTPAAASPIAPSVQTQRNVPISPAYVQQVGSGYYT